MESPHEQPPLINTDAVKELFLQAKGTGLALDTVASEAGVVVPWTAQSSRAILLNQGEDVTRQWVLDQTAEGSSLLSYLVPTDLEELNRTLLSSDACSQKVCTELRYAYVTGSTADSIQVFDLMSEQDITGDILAAGAIDPVEAFESGLKSLPNALLCTNFMYSTETFSSSWYHELFAELPPLWEIEDAFAYVVYGDTDGLLRVSPVILGTVQLLKCPIAPYVRLEKPLSRVSPLNTPLALSAEDLRSVVRGDTSPALVEATLFLVSRIMRTLLQEFADVTAEQAVLVACGLTTDPVEPLDSLMTTSA